MVESGVSCGKVWEEPGHGVQQTRYRFRCSRTQNQMTDKPGRGETRGRRSEGHVKSWEVPETGKELWEEPGEWKGSSGDNGQIV